MKNTITILILLFSFFCNSQEANLIYNWNDTSLVGSWAYDNTYNEIWGFEINNHEFAVIGSTAGTHIFDVSNVQNIYVKNVKRNYMNPLNLQVEIQN